MMRCLPENLAFMKSYSVLMAICWSSYTTTQTQTGTSLMYRSVIVAMTKNPNTGPTNQKIWLSGKAFTSIGQYSVKMIQKGKTTIFKKSRCKMQINIHSSFATRRFFPRERLQHILRLNFLPEKNCAAKEWEEWVADLAANQVVWKWASRRCWWMFHIWKCRIILHRGLSRQTLKNVAI